MACGARAQECPPAEKVATVLEKAFRQKVEVREIRPAAVEGLCEVLLMVKGKNNIIYTDPGGRYVISGQVLDAEKGRNLTRDALAELNRFTPKEMTRLASLTALTLGDRGPEVYFVTDPQ
jgi:hypothetical protein